MADREPIDIAVPFSNADVDWDKFDPASYFDDNYGHVQRGDAQIIDMVADFFQRAAPGHWRHRAIDVGAGANLYPAMTMLPFTSEIVLYERAFSNRTWLTEQLRRPAASWADFWLEVQGHRPAYRRISDPMDVLSRAAKVIKGDLFSLAPGQFDMGTMFFVAESITNRGDEFRRAVGRFVGSLVPKAPFAAAFMRESSGYIVGDRAFPSCSVHEEDVERCLIEVANVDEIRVVKSHDPREGYDSMIVAVGRRR